MPSQVFSVLPGRATRTVSARPLNSPTLAASTILPQIRTVTAVPAATRIAAASRTQPKPSPTIRPAGTRATTATSVANIATIKTFRPFLDGLVAKFPPHFSLPGAPRDKMKVPIAEGEPVNHGMVFESPGNPSSKFILPQYRIEEFRIDRPDGTQSDRYDIAFERLDSGKWALRITLEKFVSDELRAKAPDAAELEHQVTTALRFTMQVGAGGSAMKELSLEVSGADEDGVTLRCVFGSIAERDQVVSAIRTPPGATLVVRRIVDVAVPFKPKAAPRARAPAPAPSAQQLYRQVRRVVDMDIPLFLLEDVHGYVFDAISGEVSSPQSYHLRQIRWNGRHHSYFLDPADRRIVNILPDSFKVQRHEDVPRAPRIAVRREVLDDSGGEGVYLLTMEATPFVDERRLANAAMELAADADGLAPDDIEFQPLQPNGAELRLSLPSATGFGFRTIPDAMIDIRHGLALSLALSDQEFQSVFNALMGDTASLVVRGEVRVDLGQSAPESIEVIVRTDDLNGEEFDLDQTLEEDGSSLRLTLRNAIESPIRLNLLEAKLVAGGEIMDATLSGPDLSTPVEVPPGEAISFTLSPKQPSGSIAGNAGPNANEAAGEPPLGALIETLDFDVLPDSRAILDAIFDRSASVFPTRRIKVRTLQPFFEMPTDRPEDRLLAFVVEFENGDDVDLDPDNLSRDTEIRQSIEGFLLRSEDMGTYRYRVTVVRMGGMTTDDDWREGRGDTLMIHPGTL